MIEIIVKAYLEKELDVPVYLEIPEAVTEQYVTVEKTGGGKTDHVNSATIAIQSRAGSMYEAAKLNEAVKKAMDRITAEDAVSRSSLNSDYNFTDVTTGKYRYQAVYDLKYCE